MGERDWFTQKGSKTDKGSALNPCEEKAAIYYFLM